MNGVRRIVLGIDQGSRSGWAIAPERGRVLRHGLAKSHKERLAAVRLALAFAGGDPRFVFAVFEGHAHMPLDRLTNADRKTKRKGANQYAPERNTGTYIGMGKSYGRWLELLELVEVPVAHVIEVRPQTWRAATHRVQKGDVKKAAIDWASSRAGVVITDDNHAEGYCLCEYGSTHGLARYDAELQAARAEALDKRQVATQADLFGGTS